MTYPSPLSDKDLRTFFPVTRDQPVKVGVFELGLCLGGTVSAGAYTGGVLDFLSEALDAWTLAKEQGASEAPPHEVVISTVAGTSGGAINGGILLRAAGWEFDYGPVDSNPFYSSWATGVDLMKLLGTEPDGDAAGLASLFNCAAIDAQAAKTIAYKGRALGTSDTPHHRSYLADPLRLFMMVSNITGLPYSISMSGESGLAHELIAHADFLRFALTVDGGVPNPPRWRPDELALGSRSPVNWEQVQKAALATSAFPLAFRSRPLSRKLEACGYRVAAVPAESGLAKVVQLVPKWDVLTADEPDPTTSNFVNVDGGTTNNEPLDIVRMELAGVGGRNKRAPEKADRAVILIDPFSDPETLGPRTPPALIGLAMPLIMSLVYQARYKPADIALAQDEGTYSRYLVAPVGPGPNRKRTIGKAAIASGGLGGFLGFLDTRFLQYDYALGRLNAYGFVARHLALPEKADNSIFNSWTDDHRKQYRFTENGIDYLPLIPLMKRLREPPELPGWPALDQMPAHLSDAIIARLDAVYALAKAQSQPDSWWKKALMSAYLGLGWKFYLRGALHDFILSAFQDALITQELLVGRAGG